MTGRPQAQQGATLVELLISVVIVGIAASTVLSLIATTTAASADPMIRHQAAAIAESYLEEILLKPPVDPDGADGEILRTEFDDIDDYDGLVDAGARNQFGDALAGLGSYTISVAVGPSSALPGVPAANVLRVDVLVAHPNDVSYVLSGYRTRL